MWYTQDNNKLFRTGVFRKEYDDCGLGPKCPNNQSYKKNSMKTYKDGFLLSNVMHFSIRGLQDAINKYLFEKECKRSKLESGSEHLSAQGLLSMI